MSFLGLQSRAGPFLGRTASQGPSRRAACEGLCALPTVSHERDDERGRRLFAANEALALGRGGVTAVSAASGIARSTINRGIAELKAGSNELGERVRRRGGGRKSAVELQPGLLSALEELIEGAIRGDPQSPLRWVRDRDASGA